MCRRIFLLRHGEADAAGLDPRLTDAGRAAVYASIRRRAEGLRSVDSIISSPFVRARESAELAAEILSIPDPGQSPLLCPGAEIQLLFDWLQDSGEDLLLVGHNPLFSRALNDLLGYPTGRVFMDNATLVGLRLEVVAAGCAELLWPLDRG